MTDTDGKMFVSEVGGTIEILKFYQNTFEYREEKKRKLTPQHLPTQKERK